MLRLDSAVSRGLILGLRRDEFAPEILKEWRNCATVPSFAGLLAPEIELVAAIGPELIAAFEADAVPLRAELPAGGDPLIFLVKRSAPPLKRVRADGIVDALVAGAGLLRSRSLGAIDANVRIEDLCYRVLFAVGAGEADASALLVRQLPYPADWSLTRVGPEARAALIMAHRGSVDYLKTALRYIARNAGLPVKVRVGLDVERPEAYAALAGSAEFYYVRPAPCGPYVVRQELVQRSLEPAFIWQDSDDLPCSDRFVRLWAELESSGCGMVGSHELKLDEISGLVQAWRYPLDVSASLNIEAHHALLHPTSIVRRDAFHRAGGFSTDRRFSNDSQFLLRSHFSMKIRNLDEFLYIRRRHPVALTEAPDTNLRLPVRRQLRHMWNADFAAVKSGTMKLADSSLRPIAGTRRYRFERLPESAPLVRLPATARVRRRIAAMLRPAPAPVATIIVPLAGEQDDVLERSLQSALGQTAAVEVIVVVAGTVAGSNVAVLERLSARSASLRIVRGKTEDLVEAINMGLCEASTGRIGVLSSGGGIEPDAVAHALAQGYDEAPGAGGKFVLWRRERLLEVGGFGEDVLRGVLRAG